ncbi:MAG TPA: hypothetical protein PKV75_06990 [Desulfobacterales bacterium]|nr:hypothetical protein [Desulfobacterales bacterium]
MYKIIRTGTTAALGMNRIVLSNLRRIMLDDLVKKRAVPVHVDPEKKKGTSSANPAH